MYTIYGIPNCNTVKKCIDWMKMNNMAYRFHDYKKEGIDAGKVAAWCRQCGPENLLNKKGTTWRSLGDGIKASAAAEKEAIDLMVIKPSLIKRPVIELDGVILIIGFDEKAYREKIEIQVTLATGLIC